MRERSEILRISLQAVLAGGIGFIMLWIIGPMMEEIKDNREDIHKVEMDLIRHSEKIEQLEKDK